MKLLLISLFSYSLFGKILITAPEIKHYNDSKNAGFAKELIEKFKQENTDVNLKMTPMPIIRASRAYFEQKEFQCFLGGNYDVTKLYMPHFPMDTLIFSNGYLPVDFYIFSKSDNLCKAQQLENLRVATVINFPIHEFVDPKRINLLKHNIEEASAIKMLKSKRLDAFISYLPIKSHKLEGLNYCLDEPILSYLDAIQCHKSEETEEFIKKFNQFLVKIKNNGSLKALIEKYFNDRFKRHYKKLGIYKP